MKCSICGTELPDDAKFCPQCGFIVPSGHDAQTENAAHDSQGTSSQSDEHLRTFEQTVIESDEVFKGFGDEHKSERKDGPVSYCTNCGKPLDPGAEYCLNCGARAGERDYSAKGVGFVEAFKLYWKNYVNFFGRATRSEYWFVFLWQLIISFAMGIIEVVTGADMWAEALLGLEGAPQLTGMMIAVIVIEGLWELANILPMLALSVRRLHDTGKSFAWLFINFIPLVGTIIFIVLLAQPSQPRRNQYDR